MDNKITPEELKEFHAAFNLLKFDKETKENIYYKWEEKYIDAWHGSDVDIDEKELDETMISFIIAALLAKKSKKVLFLTSTLFNLRQITPVINSICALLSVSKENYPDIDVPCYETKKITQKYEAVVYYSLSKGWKGYVSRKDGNPIQTIFQEMESIRPQNVMRTIPCYDCGD